MPIDPNTHPAFTPNGGPAKLARVACVLSILALMCSATQGYFSWQTYREAAAVTRFMSEATSAMPPQEGPSADAVAVNGNSRVDLSLAEIAKRSPTLRSGNVQAWWAGEQARQVQRLEAQARRQALAGDRDGAARTISRADAIRSAIPSLAEYEKPLTSR